MRRSAALACAAFLLGACNMGLRIDPEGYRCDQGNACPTAYACMEGVCHRTGGDPCTGVKCDQPPVASCATSATLRSFSGRCEPTTGSCVYSPVDTNCPRGCVGAACVDACVGVTCTTPPLPTCISSSTLRTFSSSGSCVPATGLCSYPLTDVACVHGCSGAQCINQDLCVTVTCNMPPLPTCFSANVLRTFPATGTCNPTDGVCSYAPMDTTCASGCLNGTCQGGALTFTQIGPRVPFAVTGIDVAPGSNGDLVVAVGRGGKASQWNGFTWTTLSTPSGSDLNAVAFVSGTTAFIAGSNRTAWQFKSGAVTALGSVPGSGSANLIGLSGRSETAVLFADESGGWLRYAGGTTWTNGAFPGSSGPYAMKAVYVDESNRERVVGRCGSGVLRSSCVAYRNLLGSTPTFILYEDSDDVGMSAVGASFDVAVSNSSEAICGKPTTDVVRISNTGTFTAFTPSPALTGADVVGVSGVAAVSGARPVYVLTSSSPAPGGLFRLTRNTGSVSSAQLLTTYFGAETLSPNESAGVVVAETRTAEGVNNIFHVSTTATDALDLGEDFSGVSATPALDLVLATAVGDVATRRSGAPTMDLRRGPSVTLFAAEARAGTGVLLVGRDSSNNGVIYRQTANMFTPITISAAGVTFVSVCRNSDTEGFAVGSGGAVYSINGLTAVRMTSGTMANLTSVDCGALGQAVACGDHVALRLTGGAWQPTPNPGMAVKSCKLVNGAIFAVADNAFARLDAAAPSWASLAAKPGLTALVGRQSNDLYAAAVSGAQTDIVRWDGSSWTTLLTVSGVVAAGTSIGQRVVFAGPAGLIVEGR